MEKISNKVTITLNLKDLGWIGLVLVLIHWLYPQKSSTIINNLGGNTYNTYNLSYGSGKQLPSFNESAKITRKKPEKEDDVKDELCYGADCNDDDDDTGVEPLEPPTIVDGPKDETQDEVGTPNHSETSDSTIVTTGEDSVVDEAEDTKPVVTTPGNNTNVSEDDLIPEVIDPNDGKLRAKVVVNLNIKQ